MEKIENGMKIIGYEGNLPIIQIKYSSQQPDRFTGIIEFVDWRGRVSEIEYYFDGLLHREDGPASIGDLGNFADYYLYSVRYSYEEYYSHPRVINKVMSSIIDL